MWCYLSPKCLSADSTEPHPLMEGEGKSFRVLGFNQNQRAAFVQILMRSYFIYCCMIVSVPLLLEYIYLRKSFGMLISALNLTF